MRTSYTPSVHSVSNRSLRRGLPLALLCVVGGRKHTPRGPRAANAIRSDFERPARCRQAVRSAPRRVFRAFLLGSRQH